MTPEVGSTYVTVAGRRITVTRIEGDVVYYHDELMNAGLTKVKWFKSFIRFKASSAHAGDQ